MRTLLLSCNTGAGHNSCALAIQEAFLTHEEPCATVDALEFISEKASQFVSNWHTRIYRHAPRLFGSGYQGAEHHDDLFREGTLLYKCITAGAEKLYEFILAGGYDNIVCTHVFPALTLTEIRRRYPSAAFYASHVSTDYTCSPCTADSQLDCYFIPAASLADEFTLCGIPRNKLVPSGIPVRRAFYERCPLPEGKARLGLDPRRRHLLMMCGSMGCGPMEELASHLCGRLSDSQELTVICGTNESLYEKLQRQYGQQSCVHIYGTVDNVPQLMQSADLFLTKPGGLSTTEAMTARLPMVLIDAVAGCEEPNLDYFLHNGMAVTADTPEAVADTALELLEDDRRLSGMRTAMAACTHAPSSEIIYEWTRDHASK